MRGSIMKRVVLLTLLVLLMQCIPTGQAQASISDLFAPQERVTYVLKVKDDSTVGQILSKLNETLNTVHEHFNERRRLRHGWQDERFLEIANCFTADLTEREVSLLKR